MTKQDFFNRALPAARASGHIWPEYAVCEAALESAWGSSKLAMMANNLFGQKKGKENYPTISIPTREYINGKWVTVNAIWPVFPDWETCFRERMALLQRSPLYADALKAKNGEDFVREVSWIWATDPHRGENVIRTYKFNVGRLAEASK